MASPPWVRAAAKLTTRPSCWLYDTVIDGENRARTRSLSAGTVLIDCAPMISTGPGLSFTMRTVKVTLVSTRLGTWVCCGFVTVYRMDSVISAVPMKWSAATGWPSWPVAVGAVPGA